MVYMSVTLTVWLTSAVGAPKAPVTAGPDADLAGPSIAVQLAVGTLLNDPGFDENVHS
jgi:hypothetical protein